jgi:hypothetical protein
MRFPRSVQGRGPFCNGEPRVSQLLLDSAEKAGHSGACISRTGGCYDAAAALFCGAARRKNNPC